MTATKWIIASPRIHHGLGNRMRSVLGALSFARWTKRRFAYTWPRGQAFGAHLDELWEFDYRRLPAALSPLMSPIFPYRDGGLVWAPAASSRQVWQIRTAHALSLPEGARTWGAELRDLQVREDLAYRIDRFRRDQLGDDAYIGVMIRTHPISNAQTLLHSPVEWYLQRLRAIREERPGVRFFVSADTDEAQQALLREFPESTALTDKGAYNTKAALRSSIVDLYLLAGSGHLLAPHYSSFPELAVHLAGGGLRLESSMTEETMTLRGSDVLHRVADPLRPSQRQV